MDNKILPEDMIKRLSEYPMFDLLIEGDIDGFSKDFDGLKSDFDTVWKDAQHQQIKMAAIAFQKSWKATENRALGVDVKQRIRFFKTIGVKYLSKNVISKEIKTKLSAVK